MKAIGNQWDAILKDEITKPYYLNLKRFLIKEYQEQTIYPPMGDIYNALRYTDYKDVKVVILGQDPYHGYGQAHGLCFSVNKGVPIPPSLHNIYKEMQADLNISMPTHGNLTSWANQGVLLLNTVLTVREGCPNSHLKSGWLNLTDFIIQTLNNRKTPIVFLLWGANAKAKQSLITNPSHYILHSSHPSPLSFYRGFNGCKHFSKCNALLEKIGETAIDWKIE